jgi:uncharacterized protein YraI
MTMTRLTGCVAALALFWTADAMAAPAYVLSTVNLRAGPGTTNEVLGKIPPGTRVDAANCKGGWCEVTWQGKNGYAVVTALDLSGRPPARRVMRQPYPGQYVEVEPPTVMVGPPVYYYGYRPYGYYRPWGYRPYYYRRW